MLKTRANGRNIVGCFMLRPFVHPVASTCCCANFETFYFLSTCKRTQQLPTLLGWTKILRLFAQGFLVSLVHVIETVHAVFPANENPSEGHEFKSFASFVSSAT